MEGSAKAGEAHANPEANRAAFAGLSGAYSAEDARPLMKSFGKLARRKPALAERLLFRRNEAWCERLVRWLRDGRMFVAAGAVHLFGGRGLVTLLRGRGDEGERRRAPRAGPAVGPHPPAADVPPAGAP